MVLSANINNREFDKFEYVSGQTTVKVTKVGGLSIPGDTDAIVASYPNDTTEVYQYKTGGLSGTLLLTITVIYTDETKQNISSVVRN